MTTRNHLVDQGPWAAANPALGIRISEEWIVNSVSTSIRAEVTGATDLPLADRERDWDADAARQRMADDTSDPDVDQMRDGHFWQDPDMDPDTMEAWHLPFADVVDGTLTAIPRGIFAVAAVLQGGRGGADIPEEDQDEIKARVSTYYERMREEFDDDSIVPPWEDDDADAQAHTRRRPRGRSRARPGAGGRRGDSWYRIHNQDDDGVAVVDIYDEIGYWGVTAARFVAQLRTVDAREIELHLNTPGGNVFDGLAIFNALLDHTATVTVMVDSLAASIGSVIAQAGDVVIMGRSAEMMIHRPYGFTIGDEDEHRQMADVLARVGSSIASVYAQRSGIDSIDDWGQRMAAETWFSAQEAVDAGLADDLMPMTARSGAGAGSPENRWDLSIFNYAGRSRAPAPSGLAGRARRQPPPAQGIPARPAAYLNRSAPPGPHPNPGDRMREHRWGELTKTFKPEE